MARSLSKPGVRLALTVAVLVLAAGVAWLLIPAPFSHGLIVGLLVGPLVLVTVVLLILRPFRRLVRGMKLEAPALPGASWDYAMELTDLDGAPANLGDARGRVLVLNFWATWCRPCLAEMPGLLALRDATADLDVRFAFVTREEPAVVRTFLEKEGLGLPVHFARDEPPTCFRHRAIPATFVLDRNGRIALRHFGAAAWDAEEVVSFVRMLAGTPAGMGIS